MAAHAQRGFSLLELLVALMVVVMITSLVTLTVNTGGRDMRLENTVRSLADIAAFALDEAQMTGQDHGLMLEEILSDGVATYRFSWWVRELDGWQIPPGGQQVFDDAELPPDVEVELELEASPFNRPTVETDEEQRNPQIVLYASGETTVGALNVRRREDGDLLWRVEWDLLGRFEVMPRGELEEEWEDR